MSCRARGKADGGIGRGELFSVSLCLPLGGVVLSGAVSGGGTLFWVGALAVGALIWGALVAYIELFAGCSFGASMEYAFGRAGGRIVLFAYAVLWLVLAGCGAVYAVILWQALGAVSMSRTVYALLFLLTVAMFAASGAESLARVALLVILPSLLLVLGNLALTMNGADWGNLLPRREEGVADLWRGLGMGALLFGSGAVLLPISAQVREVKKRRFTPMLAWGAAALVMIVLSVGTRAVLSVLAEEYRFPLLQVFRLAEVGHWFSRFEVIGAGLLVVIAVIRAATMMVAAVDALCYLWRQEKRRGRYIVAVGAAVAVWAVLLVGDRLIGGWWELLLWCGGGLVVAMAIGGVVVPWAAVICGGIKYRNDHKTVIVRHDSV